LKDIRKTDQHRKDKRYNSDRKNHKSQTSLNKSGEMNFANFYTSIDPGSRKQNSRASHDRWGPHGYDD
jgi:hypothetical protein